MESLFYLPYLKSLKIPKTIHTIIAKRKRINNDLRNNTQKTKDRSKLTEKNRE